MIMEYITRISIVAVCATMSLLNPKVSLGSIQVPKPVFCPDFSKSCPDPYPEMYLKNNTIDSQRKTGKEHCSPFVCCLPGYKLAKSGKFCVKARKQVHIDESMSYQNSAFLEPCPCCYAPYPDSELCGCLCPRREVTIGVKPSYKKCPFGTCCFRALKKSNAVRLALPLTQKDPLLTSKPCPEPSYCPNCGRNHHPWEPCFITEAGAWVKYDKDGTVKDLCFGPERACRPSGK